MTILYTTNRAWPSNIHGETMVMMKPKLYRYCIFCWIRTESNEKYYHLGV